MFWKDLVYALRGMKRSPAFTAVIVSSLALGIGANTAIFTLINAVMLRALPVRDPQQLVELLVKYPGEPAGSFFSFRSYEHYRGNNHVFAGVIGDAPSDFRVRYENDPLELADGEAVTGDFFSVLGVTAAAGRLIGPEDSTGLVLGWGYWETRFRKDPGVLGKRITVNNVSFTIIGIAPSGFFGLQMGTKPKIWILANPSSGGGSLRLAARLKTGVSIEQARAEMPVLSRFTIDERAAQNMDPLVRQLKFDLQPASSGFSAFRNPLRTPLLVLMAVVALLLLIACTNVASMLLSRAAAREHEMEVRLSLGASRLHLVRQVLTESVLLAAIGGAAAVLVAYVGVRALTAVLLSGNRLPRMPKDFEISVQPDIHVLLFTVATALLAGLIFGLAPARRALSSRLTERIKLSRYRQGAGRGLVIAQVGFSTLLLSAAILFVGYLSNLEHLDLGFRRDHVLLVALDPLTMSYSSEQMPRVCRELLARLESIPGVLSVSLGDAPLSGAGASSFAVAEGFTERPEDRRYVSIRWVGPRYFETLGTPLRAGRDFRFDDVGGPRMAIINQAMARYFFGGRNPIGQHMALERDWKGFGLDKPYEVIGVVGDAKYYEIREAPPRTIYFNAFREENVRPSFVLSATIDPDALSGAVRRVIAEQTTTTANVQLTTLDRQVNATIVPERLIAGLSGWFGALGAGLAAIGIYGLLAYSVAHRVREIGIRMALGATRVRVLRMVLREALVTVCAGLLLGIPLAFWGKAVAASLIPDLPAKNPAPVIFGGLALIALALLAAYLPARRAARVEPAEALRHE